MAMNLVKLPTGKSNLMLRVSKGHFATGHSHINYYIDVTLTKCRLSEARAAAAELVKTYTHTTIVDTILCLDGTEVIGACMASELTKAGYINMNAHQTIYVVTPEYDATSQLIFRDNLQPMIRDKHVLILTASVTMGISVRKAMECVQYYGGTVAGACGIFSACPEVDGMKIQSIFGPEDISGYATYPVHDCPLCKQKAKLEALVNGYGYSKL